MKKKLSLFVISLVLILGMLLCGSVYADTGANDVSGITEVINGLATYSVAILGVLGALAFAVQVIVQVTKEVPPIKRVPTKLYVIVISLIICELALFMYASWASIAVLWYYIVLTLFMAMVVAYISMYGWDALKDLYLRYSKPRE